MSKRGRLSKVELSYIRNNFGELSLGDIAKDLDRTQDIVRKAIVDMQLENEVSEEKRDEHTTTTNNGTKSGDLMGRKVRNGQVTTTVMTEAASERLDEAREKRRRKVNTNHFTEDAVFKPLGKGKHSDDGKFKKSGK